MAGLISPKPIYHPQGNGQYSSYARGLSVFSETPPLSTAPQSQHSLGAFTNAGITHPLMLQADTKIVVDLMDPATREAALLELSKKREQYDDLALVLWHSFGRNSVHIDTVTEADFIQELCPSYCKKLFRCILCFPHPISQPMCRIVYVTLWRYFSVSHRTQIPANSSLMVRIESLYNISYGITTFLAHIPLFLYPFLNTISKTRPFEYLRLTSLGVIGALVKVRCHLKISRYLGFNAPFEQQNDNNAVIHFLLSTEIIPLCLRIMETGSELSKTVAIFIVQKILLDETGLTYICHTYERFYAVGTVLSNMVNQLVETQAVRLLKHVVRCYLRLSDNLRYDDSHSFSMHFLLRLLITVAHERHCGPVYRNHFVIKLSVNF
jgi:CCR4-NOT transcription complex subunit 9